MSREGTLNLKMDSLSGAANDMEAMKKELAREQRRIRIRKFTKNKASVFGLIVVVTMLILAIFAPVICQHDGTLILSHSVIFDGQSISLE